MSDCELDRTKGRFFLRLLINGHCNCEEFVRDIAINAKNNHLCTYEFLVSRNTPPLQEA